jgi:putative ABC transport system permease protein
MLDSFVNDIRYAIRTLLNHPGLTCAALLALAMGIGANTTIFSFVNSILLRPLPVENADRLVFVWQTNRQKGTTRLQPSYPDFVDFRAENTVFEDIAAIVPTQFNLTGFDRPYYVSGMRASASLFSTLGVKPLRGRTFQAEEDRQNGSRVAVISSRLWRSRFGAGEDVLNRQLILDDQSYTIIGVLPSDFNYLPMTDVWVPLFTGADPKRMEGRSYHDLMVTACLKPGVSIEAAQSQINTLATQLQTQYPDTNAGNGVVLVPFRDLFVGEIKGVVFALWIAVGLVLLIACTNVANLMLARGAARQNEIAVRSAIGAKRTRLIMQLLTESILLGVIGGLLGLAVTWLGIRLIEYGTPANVAQLVPGLKDTKIDGVVLAFTLTISVFTGALFGLIPAIQASKPNLNELLKDSGRGLTGGLGKRRLRTVLVISEIALVLVLLNSVGLVISSFLYLLKVDPGFRPGNLLTARLALPARKYTTDQEIESFYRELRQRLEVVPGVLAVGAISHLPMGSVETSSASFKIEGRPVPAANEAPWASFRVVSPDYFRTLEVQVKQGRAFTDLDSSGNLPVVIVNEHMAKEFWPNEDPLGKRLSSSDDEKGQPIWRQIVGVVGDARYSLEFESRPEMYLPLAQRPMADMSVLVRTSTDPMGLVSAVQEQVWSIDKDLPVSHISTMERIVADSVSPQRAGAVLFGFFAFTAFILVAVGIHGLIAFSVTQRTREIGIRMALGALPRTILTNIFGEAVKLVLIGVAIGLVPTFLVTKLLAHVLPGASAAGVPAFFGVLIMLAGITVLASYFPARRAAGSDPVVALRNE